MRFRFGRAPPEATGVLGIHIDSQGVCVAHSKPGAPPPAPAIPQQDRAPRAALAPRPHLRLLHAEERSAAALQALLKPEGLHRLPCHAVLGHDEYQLLLAEAADVPPADLAGAMRWRIKDMISFPVEEALVDVIQIPAGAARGGPKNVMVAVARQQTVRQHIELLQKCGLDVLSLDIADLAVRNVAELSPFEKDGVGVLTGTPSFLVFSIYRGGALYLSRRILTGLDDVARAMAGDVTAQDEFLAQVTPDLRRSLDYYESHHGRAPLKALYAWPPDGLMLKFGADLAEILGVPSRTPPVQDLLEVNVDLAQCSAAGLLAIGGALRKDAAA